MLLEPMVGSEAFARPVPQHRAGLFSFMYCLTCPRPKPGDSSRSTRTAYEPTGLWSYVRSASYTRGGDETLVPRVKPLHQVDGSDRQPRHTSFGCSRHLPRPDAHEGHSLHTNTSDHLAFSGGHTVGILGTCMPRGRRDGLCDMVLC